MTRNFGYDAAGNQTSSPVNPTTNSTWTYDARNKPLTTTVPGQPVVTYTYDALGRRSTRTASGATETYHYVGDAIARIDRGGGNVTDSAIDSMGDRLTVGATWTVPNVRGDVAALLNSGQTAISDAYRYDPFCVTLATQGTTTNPYRFQGRLLESTSGQYDFGARQYDPATGAFTGLDSVLGSAQNPLSLNRYLYGHANPEVMIDLDGHAAEQFDSRQQQESAIRSARASVAAARQRLARASHAYRSAVARVTLARAQLTERCPITPCSPNIQKEWKQSKLDAYEFALSERAQAKAQLDAASAAVGAAERGLKAIEAVAPATRYRVSAKKGVSGEDIARFVVGFVGGAAASVATAAVGTAAAVGTVGSCAFGSFQCTMMMQSIAGAGADAIADPGQTVRDLANSTASTIGRMREDVLSGDGFRAGSVFGDIAFTAATFVGPGVRGASLARTASTPAVAAVAKVDSAVAQVIARGGLKTTLSPAQIAAGAAYPNLMKAYLGSTMHSQVALELGPAFSYSRRGIDFTELATGARVELTTTRDLAAHELRYGRPNDLFGYATYALP